MLFLFFSPHFFSDTNVSATLGDKPGLQTSIIALAIMLLERLTCTADCFAAYFIKQTRPSSTSSEEVAYNREVWVVLDNYRLQE
ncbi:MAG: hypothetical protein L0H55_06355 [Candidatus Nitrosocosmicus sp.]|nr:hypothetical protein [Candidatus Nitrosocosmicus sp.]